ncbi:MAG TPA: hypothetical protein VHB98_22570, partial [Chloroflexota bacterium]|nr:hypothetical protein [Chloroflexota bacterium]
MLTSEAAIQAMGEEREQYGTYIAQLQEEDLCHVELLPYRRILSREEGLRLWRRLRRRWDLPDFPLHHKL